MVYLKQLFDQVLTAGHYRAPFIKMMSFALIGAVNATIDILVFSAAYRLLLIVTTTSLVILSHYTNIWAAKFISIVVGFAVNFSMSHFVIFRALYMSKAVD